MTSNPISLLLSILLGLAAPAGAAAREVPTPGDAGELSDAFVAVTERLAQERRSLGRRYFELARLDEAAFVAAWDEPWEDQRRRLEAVIAEHEPPPPVARDERARITYGWALGRLEYEEVHRQVELDPAFEVGADYDAYLDGIESVAPELASVPGLPGLRRARHGPGAGRVPAAVPPRHHARERRRRRRRRPALGARPTPSATASTPSASWPPGSPREAIWHRRWRRSRTWRWRRPRRSSVSPWVRTCARIR